MTVDYNFDGTYIDFDIVCADAMGVVPQTGQAANITPTLYDSAMNSDAATIAVAEIGSTGLYRARTTYANLNRAAGDGLWRWTFTHSSPDYTFWPMAVSIQISREIGTVNNTDFTPTTTQVELDGISDSSTDHYKDAFIRVIDGNNKGEVRKITASSVVVTRVRLTFNAMDSALANGVVVEIINR